MKTQTEIQKTVLRRKESCFNPMFLGNKQIHHLTFYSSQTGKTILAPNDERVRWFGSNNEHPEIFLPFEIKRKNTVDLSSKVPFYSAYASQYSHDKGQIVVYIPIEILTNFTEEKRVLRFETDTTKEYQNNYSFEILCTSYRYFTNDMGEFCSEITEPKITKLTFSGYYESELKPLGQKIKSIQEALKPVLEISGYDIEKILKVADITIK